MSFPVRLKNKEFFWKIVGPYCRRCGYNECISSLHMHHITSQQKESRSDSLARWISLSRYELIKKITNTEFTILCSNCHTFYHTTFPQDNVFNSPIDTTLFKEMLKCMFRLKKSINKDLIVIGCQEIEEWVNCLDYAESISKTRKERIQQGIDCNRLECGFCGIEKLFPKENQE